MFELCFSQRKPLSKQRARYIPGNLAYQGQKSQASCMLSPLYLSAIVPALMGGVVILSKKYEIIPSSKILFPFLIVQAGHCSCEVPPDKSETERDEKAPDEARKCEPAWNLTVVIQPSRLKG